MLPQLLAVTAVLLVPLAMLSLLQRHLNASGDAGLGSLVAILAAVGGLVYYVLQPAAVRLIVSTHVVGQSTSPSDALRGARARFWPLVRLGLLKWVLLTVGLSLAVGLVVVLALLGRALGDAGILLAVVATIGLVVATIHLLVRWSLAEPALLLEGRLGARAALGRSIALVDGAWWPIALTLVAVWVISSLLNYAALAAALGLTGELQAFLQALSNEEITSALTMLQTASDRGADVLRTLITTSVAVLLAPLTAIAPMVLYLGRRSEREGLDLIVAAQATDESR
jgi:hypothetical protein